MCFFSFFKLSLMHSTLWDLVQTKRPIQQIFRAKFTFSCREISVEVNRNPPEQWQPPWLHRPRKEPEESPTSTEQLMRRCSSPTHHVWLTADLCTVKTWTISSDGHTVSLRSRRVLPMTSGYLSLQNSAVSPLLEWSKSPACSGWVNVVWTLWRRVMVSEMML